jgi:hypothetical protein
VNDLLERVMHLSPGDCLITDESSLWDFHTDETNDDYFRRISLIYGIDARHVEPPTLVAISELIAKSRGSQ